MIDTPNKVLRAKDVLTTPEERGPVLSILSQIITLGHLPYRWKRDWFGNSYIGEALGRGGKRVTYRRRYFECVKKFFEHFDSDTLTVLNTQFEHI